MRLKALHIKGYKNFEDIKFDHFDITNRDITTVLIGRNGSGKSNLFEILVTIFRNYEYPSNETKFSYDLEYIINGIRVKIYGNNTSGNYKHQGAVFSESQNCFVDFAKKDFKEAGFLPENIIAYYSGATSRLEELFVHHQRRYVAQLTKNSAPGFRRLFIAKEEHLPLIVLTQLVYSKKRNNAFKELRLRKAERVTIKLGKPSGFRPELLNEDDRYWGARGRLKEFFTHLETLDSGRDIHSYTYASNDDKDEYVFDFFNSINILGRDLADLSGFTDSPNEFFRLLEEAYRLRLIKSVEILLVQGEENEKTFLYEHLSEGEKQLLLVLGMIDLTKNQNSLILLDEPDTHLNPRWKYDYVDLIKSVIGESLYSKVQVLLATHEPLIVSGLDKENVLHFKRNKKGEITMDHVGEDLKGKGVEAILTSNLFGLNTTLDKYFLQKSIRRRELLVKKHQNNINRLELEELSKLNDDLHSMDFNIPFGDPLYRDFIVALGNLEKYKEKYISENQRTRRTKIAQSILEELMNE